MCDYSQHNVASRPARVGDRLVSSGFRDSITRGFAAIDDGNVAVCLMPGTELAFEADVESLAAWQGEPGRNFEQKVARFRQINVENPMAHHDALEFPDGAVVLVTNLREGQRATVLQLPPTAHPAHPASEPAAGEKALSV
jgi:hypothetical protein